MLGRRPVPSWTSSSSGSAARANRRTVLRARPSSAAIARTLRPPSSSWRMSACRSRVRTAIRSPRGHGMRPLRRVRRILGRLQRDGCGQMLAVPGDGTFHGARRGCATGASGRRPGSRPARRGRRRRRSSLPGPGRSAPRRDGRPARRRRSQPTARAGCRPAGGSRRRPAAFRNSGRGAARTHRRPAPAGPDLLQGRAGHGSAGSASSGSPRPLTGPTAGPRPGRPAPARPPAARRSAPELRRAYRLVSPPTCSAKVTFAQPGTGQKNRRTRQADHHLPAARGRIQQPPLIPAVHPPRHRAAPGACRR